MDFLKTTSSGDNSNATSNGNSSDSRLLFGPQLRYYLPINSPQSFFLGAVSDFGNSNTDIVVDGKTQKVSTNIKSIGFGPGYTIFPIIVSQWKHKQNITLALRTARLILQVLIKQPILKQMLLILWSVLATILVDNILKHLIPAGSYSSSLKTLAR